MKEEKEIVWLVNLLNSPNFSNSFFKERGGSRKDFEEEINGSINDKYFRKWFDSLLENGIVKFVRYENNERGGNRTKIYVINKSKCLKYLKTFEIYQKTKKIVLNNDII